MIERRNLETRPELMGFKRRRISGVGTLKKRLIADRRAGRRMPEYNIAIYNIDGLKR